jgi:hypothetical protein
MKMSFMSQKLYSQIALAFLKQLGPLACCCIDFFKLRDALYPYLIFPSNYFLLPICEQSFSCTRDQVPAWQTFVCCRSLCLNMFFEDKAFLQGINCVDQNVGERGEV